MNRTGLQDIENFKKCFFLNLKLFLLSGLQMKKDKINHCLNNRESIVTKTGLHKFFLIKELTYLYYFSFIHYSLKIKDYFVLKFVVKWIQATLREWICFINISIKIETIKEVSWLKIFSIIIIIINYYYNNNK